MKKLALVLGSLLVVGSVASAKEVVPAPVVEPEVRIIERPVEVIVYRDRIIEKEAPAKWRPNGYVSVTGKVTGEVEGTKALNDRTWDGDNRKGRLELKTGVALTPNQSLEIRSRNWQALSTKDKVWNEDEKKVEAMDHENEVYVQHTYDFGKVFDTKIDVAAETKYKYTTGNNKSLRERIVFNFADYLFNNDFIKTTNAVIAPQFTYSWSADKAHTNNYGIYADFAADLMYGFDIEAEFDSLLDHPEKYQEKKEKSTYSEGNIEITLNRNIELFANDKHELVFNPALVYATNWAWDSSSERKGKGTEREDGSHEKWGSYTAKFEPQLEYAYAATEYVTLGAKVAAEYINRTDDRHAASHWRWQPYAELGMKVNF